MAKITYTTELNSDPLYAQYDSEMYISLNEKGTKLTFEDGSGDAIVFRGRGITVEGQEISGGKIDSIVFHGGMFPSKVDETDVRVFATLEGKYKATDLLDAYVDGGTEGLFDAIFAGNDTLKGSSAGDYLLGYGGKDVISGGKGVDFIGGGAGKDELTGGSGMDVFMFAQGDGKDVITDFDSDGSDDKQDRIWLTAGDSYELSKNADKDAVLTFEDGSTLTLVGVKMNSIDEGDFYFPIP